MVAHWPFVALGMDVIRPIEPKASNGHQLILFLVDYLIKRVEAITFKVVTKKAVVDFFPFEHHLSIWYPESYHHR